MTQLLLVRHAEPLAATAEPGAAGADPAISPRGEEQADRFAKWLAGAPERDEVAEVVTSTMRRARESAAPAVRLLGLPEPAGVEELCEFDRGRPSYRPVHLRDDTDEDWQAIRSGVFPSFVDGPAFTARVVAALDAIAARQDPRGTALVVCHAGVINTYVTGILGIDRPLVFPLHHTSVTRVLVSRSGARRVSSVNETQHLAGML
ncbi:histidine phosphatase family protein [Actinomycetospora aeridis]|uniref:Histidine phosphatase family protein n=1 Tax=Actinomycetospora aeridis TaxID=3129231 RepID=A0ABU8N3V3_9PSEU